MTHKSTNCPLQTKNFKIGDLVLRILSSSDLHQHIDPPKTLKPRLLSIQIHSAKIITKQRSFHLIASKTHANINLWISRLIKRNMQWINKFIFNIIFSTWKSNITHIWRFFNVWLNNRGTTTSEWSTTLKTWIDWSTWTSYELIESIVNKCK